MRVQATATTMSWIPSDIVGGALRKGFDVGLSHYDPPPPDRLAPGEVHELSAADRFRFGNLLTAWAEVADGRIVDAGYGEDAGLVIGITGGAGRPAAGDVPGRPAAHDPARPRADRRRRRPAGADRRGPHRRTAAASGAPPALRAVVGARGVDHAGRDAPPRRQQLDRAARGEPVPAALGLRLVRGTGRPQRGHRPEGLGQRVLRRPDAVGRPGLTRAGRRRRHGPRAAALERHHARRPSRDPQARAGRRAHPAGRAGRTSSTSSSTACSTSTSTAPRSARSVPGAVLGERALLEDRVRTSTLTAATRAVVAVAPEDAVDLERLAELSAGHRREETGEAGQ